MDFESEEESEPFSDVDPQDLIDSLKGMDDMDADLFSNNKTKTKSTNNNSKSKIEDTSLTRKKFTKPDKKKVSFQESTDVKKDEYDFDLDDPLADILSNDEDSFQEVMVKMKQSTNVANKYSPSKNKKTSLVKQTPINDEKEDSLFGDDEDAGLGALGIDDDKNSTDNNTKTSMARLDELLKPSNKLGSDRPSSVEGRRGLKFDKDGNFIKGSLNKSALTSEANTSNNVKDVSFGSYMPSVGSNVNTERSDNKKSDGNFFDFLNKDIASSSKNTKSDKPSPTIKPQSATNSRHNVTKNAVTRPKSADFLGLGNEVDLDSILGDSQQGSLVGTPLTPQQQTNTFMTSTKNFDDDLKPKLSPAPSPVTSKPPRTRSTPLNLPSSANTTFQDSIQLDQDPPLGASLNGSLSRPNTLGRPSSNGKVGKPSFNQTTVRRTSVSDDEKFQEILFNEPTVSARVPQTTTSNTPPVHNHSQVQPFDSTSRPAYQPQTPSYQPQINPTLQTLQRELDHTKALLHETQLGFQRDLEICQTTYDGRVKILQQSMMEVRSRSEREIESIKESYNARLEAVRRQSREAAVEAAGRDLVEQDEIKRLRELHLSAIEDTRLDYEEQMKRLKLTHKSDIDALKTSTTYVRNIENMMEKVDTSTQMIQQLSVKYESAFSNMTQRSEDTTQAHKQILSVVEKQLNQIQRSNELAQSSLQQTVSRLEGTISQMNQRFEQQQYTMQAEQNRLQSFQTSMENEKKQIMQQVAAERDMARKAHNEAMELQQTLQREAREDRQRFQRREEEQRVAQRALEDARIGEEERSSQRERERLSAAESLSRDRSSLAERAERMASTEARIGVLQEEFNRRSSLLSKEERDHAERMSVLERREKEVQENEERNSKAVNDARQGMEEINRVEQQHKSRMNELHVQTEELARQRQLLAEERKLLVEERLQSKKQAFLPFPGSSPAPYSAPLQPQYDMTPTKLLVSDLRSSQNKTDAGSVLWKHSAQKDHDFLDDEQHFLEALKHTPYHVTQKSTL